MRCKVWDPAVTETTVVDCYDDAAGLTYVSNSSLAYWRGRYWVVMDGTTQGFVEGSAGQSIWLKSAETVEGLTDAVAVQPFRDPTHCSNPVTAPDLEWQPNLVVVGDELWCTWSGGYGYVSKLADPDGSWSNHRYEFIGQQVFLSSTVSGAATAGRALFPTIDGLSDWLPFAATNPIVLSSGVVAVPITLESQQQSTQTTASSSFTKALKYNAVFRCDDGEWSMVLIDTSDFGDFCAWEPFLVENRAGHVRVFTRNLDARVDDTEFLLVATSYDGGLTFSPSVATNMQVPSTRGFARQVSPKRWLMTHIDRPQFSNNTANQDTVTFSRRNGAVGVSRLGGDDFVFGVPFSGHNSMVNYPQFIVDPNTGDYLINYTPGIGSTVRKSLRIVRMSPGLDDDYAYIHPRSTPSVVTTPNDPVIRDGAYQFNGFNQIRSTTELAASTGVTYAAWIRRDAEGDVIADSRDTSNGGQVLRTVGLSLPGVNFLHGFAMSEQPCLLAAVINNSTADTITFYLGQGDTEFATTVCYYKSLLFSGQPSNGETISIDGATYTFRTSASLARDVQIGANAAATITNLRTKLLDYSMQGLAFTTRLILTRATDNGPLPVVSGAANVSVETGMPLDGGTVSFGMKAGTSSLAPFSGEIFESRIYASALSLANLTYLYNARASQFDYPHIAGTSTAPAAPLIILDATAPDDDEFPPITVAASCDVDDDVLTIHGECSAGQELPWPVTDLTIRFKLSASPVSTDKCVIATFGTVDDSARLYIDAANPTKLYCNDRLVKTVAAPTEYTSVTVRVFTNKIQVGGFEQYFSGRPRCYLGSAYPEGLLAVSKHVDFDTSVMEAVKAYV